MCDWTRTMRESISKPSPRPKEKINLDELPRNLSVITCDMKDNFLLPRLVSTQFHNKYIIDLNIDDDQIIRLTVDDLEKVGQMLLKTVKKSREMMNESR